MRRWWPYVVFGLLAYLLFLLVRLPAGYAYAQLAPRLGVESAGVALGGLEGTLWHGRAARLAFRGELLGSLGWELSPWVLLRGHLGADLTLQGEEGYLQGYGEFPFGDAEVRLTGIEGRLPLARLQRYLKAIPLPLQGSLSFNLSRLSLQGDGCPSEAEGMVVWHQAGVSAPQELAFGDLRLVLRQGEEGIEGELADGGGPLRLQATLKLGGDGAYRLNGTVAAAESATPALRQSLAMLGRSDAEGRYPLNFSGKL